MCKKYVTKFFFIALIMTSFTNALMATAFHEGEKDASQIAVDFDKGILARTDLVDVHIYSLEKGEDLMTIKSDNQVDGVLLSPDSEWIGIKSGFHTCITLYNLFDNTKHEKEFEEIIHTFFSYESQSLFIAKATSILKLDLNTGKTSQLYHFPDYTLLSAQLSLCGKHIIAAFNDNKIRIFGIDGVELFYERDIHENITAMHLSKDSLIAVRTREGHIKVFNYKKEAPFTSFFLDSYYKKRPFIFTKDGKNLLVASKNGVSLGNIKEGKIEKNYREENIKITTIHHSDGLVMAGCDGGELIVWNETSCEIFKSFKKSGPVNAIAHDGNYFLLIARQNNLCPIEALVLERDRSLQIRSLQCLLQEFVNYADEEGPDANKFIEKNALPNISKNYIRLSLGEITRNLNKNTDFNTFHWNDGVLYQSCEFSPSSDEIDQPIYYQISSFIQECFDYLGRFH